MSDKFRNRYRIQSIRLQKWDYGWNGAYFVTICTKNRIAYFGFVKKRKMYLSEIGKIVQKYWNEIPNHFPFVRLDAFVVMPNHVHGIIIIDKNDGDIVGTQNADTHNAVETQDFASLQQWQQRGDQTNDNEIHRNKFGPQSQNLASIVRGYKIGVTKNARMLNPDFGWQRLYYDHIIRDRWSYETIHDYIIANPENWHGDRFYRN